MHKTAISALARIQQRFVPKFNVKNKRNVWHQNLISRLLKLVGNPYYMADFWTTIGYTVYRPNLADMPRFTGEYSVLWHEGRHALQAKKYTRLVMGFLYLFPLSLIPIFGLLSILSLWFLIPTALCFLPWPAYWRMKMEVEGYSISMRCDYYEGKALTDDRLEVYSKYFTGWDYYKMWPFKKDIIRRLVLQRNRIVSNQFDKYEEELYTWMVENSLTK